MIIGGRKISPGEPPYVVAEASCSHCGSLDKALALISRAKDAGADSIKFQAYTADTITLDCDKPDFIVADGTWKGRKLYELYQKAHTPFEWFPSLFEHAKKVGITLFASVFDKSSVDLLATLGCPCYKIASMEIVDTPLIEYAASKGKPVILSTGMASSLEINDAIDACYRHVPYATLHCVSGYPAKPEEYNLHMMDEFSKIYGVSDHTVGWGIPVAATAMGAQIIEKHLCISRNDPTEDAAFSLEPDEFRQMCRAVKAIWYATQPSHGPSSEDSSVQLRRSLYVVQDMLAGDVFTEDNVRSIRPGYGLPPSELPNVLGKVAVCDIERGTALEESLVGGLTHGTV